MVNTDETVKEQTIHTRMADPTEGPAIHDLCIASGMWEIEGIDWTKPIVNWWVAEDKDGLVGCVQCNTGVPVAHNEFLFVHPRLTHRERATVVRWLCELGAEYQGLLGAQLVTFTVPDTQDDWHEVAKRHNCTDWYHGTVLIRRV